VRLCTVSNLRLLRLPSWVFMLFTMPSCFCAWCGNPVSVGVAIAGVVVYHELCLARRTRLLKPWGGPQ
jgi:hypothetical protein